MAALSAEFASEVIFHPAPPSVISAPSVAVIPGDPFLEPETQGLVRERWDVWVAASLKSPDRGAADMREISLRVMRAAHSVGGVWRNASGPRRLAESQTMQIVSVNRIDFKYSPSEVVIDDN